MDPKLFEEDEPQVILSEWLTNEEKKYNKYIASGGSGGSGGPSGGIYTISAGAGGGVGAFPNTTYATSPLIAGPPNVSEILFELQKRVADLEEALKKANHQISALESKLNGVWGSQIEYVGYRVEEHDQQLKKIVGRFDNHVNGLIDQG